MSWCRTEYHADNGSVLVCTRSRGHHGAHHAYDATTSFMWPDGDSHERTWMDRPHEFVEFEASDQCLCGSLWHAEIHNTD
jgi:hypothetical protein